MNHTHEARIDFTQADVAMTLVHKVMVGAITPLAGAPDVSSNVTPGKGGVVTLRFYAFNDNEAQRTAAVAASAVKPLTRAVMVPTVRALEVTR